MKMKSSAWLFAGLMALVLLGGCLKRGSFPDEPYMEFKSFTGDPDNAIMTFRFTDGDGNVGLGSSDTLPPFQPSNDPLNLYHWNLWIKYYLKVNGEWQEVPLDPNSTYSRIPRLDPEGQNKALEGEVIIDMTGWYPLVCTDESARYGVILIDRDLNHSNEAFSDEILFPVLADLIPASGTFTIGSNIPISWSALRIPPGDKLRVQFSSNGGGNWTNISPELNASETSYTWASFSYHNGNPVTPAANGKFRVVSDGFCNPAAISHGVITLQ